MTPQKETMLLTHFLTLCLRLDNYACDASLIAVDLGLPLTLYVLPSGYRVIQRLTSLPEYRIFSRVLVRPIMMYIAELNLSLGCTITSPSRGQQTNSENGGGTKSKLAVLKVPLVFPKIRRRR
jgi:hypothetical protein